MATKNYGTTFKSAVNRGTPATTVVATIAKKSRKTESQVWSNLFSNGYVNRRKVNGSFIYWPNFKPARKPSAKNFKNFTFQQFINWAIISGYCTPDQVNNLKSQKDFFNFFGPFLAKQFSWNVSSGWTLTKVKNFKPMKKVTKKTSKRKSSKRHTSAMKRKTTKSKKRSTSCGRKSTTTRRKSTLASRHRKSTTARRKTAASRKKTTTRRKSTAASRRRKTTTASKRTGRKTTSSRSYKFPKSSRKSYRRAA